MIPLFIDVETTGLEADDRLVQVAYKNPWTAEGDPYWNELFKSPKPMSVDAMSVCHITNRMLEDKPVFIGSDMYEHLQEKFDDPSTVFVAHNADFDRGFFLKEGMQLPEKYICTYKVAHHHDKKAELPKHTLQYLRYLREIESKPGQEVIMAHDALSDVIVLEGLFDWFLQHYTMEEMIEISKQPILFKKLLFGKYQGQSFTDVARKDFDYLLWMRRAMTLDVNMKHTLEHYINNR